MPTFIKTGYWEKLSKGYKNWLNLNDLINELVPASNLTIDELSAIQGANSPNVTNVFVTESNVALVNQYTGYFSQVGTNAPTVVSMLKDTLNSPVWSYSAVGVFLLTKIGAFVTTKTVPDKIEVYTDNDGNKYTLERTSSDIMTLKTYAAIDTEVLANDVLLNQFINIEVFL